MVIIREIRDVLEFNGYTKTGDNILDIDIYYKIQDNIPQIIVLLQHDTISPYSMYEYEGVIRKIRDQTLMSHGENPRILSIICSSNIENSRYLYSSLEQQWFVDLIGRKIIIYESYHNLFRELEEELEEQLYNKRQRSKKVDIKERKLGLWMLTKKYKKFSVCNSTIILINIIVFLVMEAMGSTIDGEFMQSHGAMYWPLVVNKGEYYRLFTYMFLHFGPSHLINNMIILGFIGDNLEREVGKIKYISIYLIAGIIAGTLSMVYNIMKGTDVLAVGASGAIFGVVGAVLYIIIVNKGKLEDLSIRQVLLFSLLSLYNGFTSQGIDNMAHIAGFIAGILLAMILYKKPKGKNVEERPYEFTRKDGMK